MVILARHCSQVLSFVFLFLFLALDGGLRRFLSFNYTFVSLLLYPVGSQDLELLSDGVHLFFADVVNFAEKLFLFGSESLLGTFLFSHDD